MECDNFLMKLYTCLSFLDVQVGREEFMINHRHLQETNFHRRLHEMVLLFSEVDKGDVDKYEACSWNFKDMFGFQISLRTGKAEKDVRG